MFIWGWLLVGLGTLVLRRPSPRSLLSHWRTALASALPVLAPLLWLSHAAENANVAFITERWSSDFLIRWAQDFVDVFPALLVGNLTGLPELRLWGRDGPIAVAVALGARPSPAGDATFEPWRARPAIVLATIALGLGVLWRGASFDLATVWWNHRSAGTKGVYAEAERFTRSLRAPARVALVGRHQLLSDGSPVPLAYLGLVGNAPLLVPGLETAHLHEPMESEAAAKHHHRLGTPWRIAVSQDFVREQPELARQKLESIGVTALVALDPSHLPEDAGTRPFRSSDGRTLWVRELSPSPPYPLRGPGERLPGGALLVPARDSVRPTRPLEATLTPNGWVLAPPVPWRYVVPGALGIVAALGLLVWPLRRRALERDASRAVRVSD
jgi:hypothetical protein